MKRLFGFLLVLTLVVSSAGIASAIDINWSKSVQCNDPNRFEEDYNISYYEVWQVGGKYDANFPPLKIRSVAELADNFPYWQEVSSKYDASFFSDKFLVFIYRVEPNWQLNNLRLRVTSVQFKDGKMNIGLTRHLNAGDADDVLTTWGIFLEMPLEYADNDVVVGTDFGPVPSTGLPDVTGYAAATLVFLAASAILWGRVLRRKYIKS